MCGVLIYLSFFLRPVSPLSPENIDETNQISSMEDPLDILTSSDSSSSFEEDYYAGLEEFFSNEENYYENIQGEYGFIQ